MVTLLDAEAQVWCDDGQTSHLRSPFLEGTWVPWLDSFIVHYTVNYKQLCSAKTNYAKALNGSVSRK